MKKLLLFIILYFSTIQTFCAIKTVVANGGTGWGNANNWSPVGVPTDGDIVVIPIGRTISVKGSFYAAGDDLLIQVYGTLDFDPSGKLNLGNLSSVQLFLVTSSITSNGTSSELITIDGITKYRGSTDGTLIGPKFASALTGTSPSGFMLGVLPASITDFSASLNNGSCTIEWTSVEEQNIQRYIVEKSTDGTIWSPLKSTPARGSRSRYLVSDVSPVNGRNFYRLKIEDLDLSVSYSKTIQVDQTDAAPAVRYSVSGNLLTLHVPVQLKAGSAVLITDLSGRTLLSKKVNSRNGDNIQLELPNHKGGIYIVSINSGTVKESFSIFLR